MLLLAALFSTTFVVMRAGSTLFYFKYVVGDDGRPLSSVPRQVVGVSFFRHVVPSARQRRLGRVREPFDKRKAATWLTLVTGTCYAAFFALPKDNFALQLAVNAVGMLCMGPASALVFAMYGDVADYGEWKFGRRSTGLVYSASLFAMKTGSMLAGAFVPLFLDAFGFVRDAQQTTMAILGITLAFSLVPGLFAVLKAWAIWGFPLSAAEVAQIETDLRARKAT